MTSGNLYNPREQQLYVPENDQQKAVVSLDYLLETSIKEVHALLVGHWLQDSGLRVTIPPEVEQEYQRLHYQQRGRETGLPIAPRSFQELFTRQNTRYTPDLPVVGSLAPLPQESYSVLNEAVYLAQLQGSCYVLSNDAQLNASLQDISRERGANIIPVDHDYVEKNLNRFFTPARFELILSQDLLSQIYGSAQNKFQQGDETPLYLSLKRGNSALGKSRKTIRTYWATELTATRPQHRASVAPILPLPTSDTEAVLPALAIYQQLNGIDQFIGTISDDRNFFPTFFTSGSLGGQYHYNVAKWATTTPATTL